MGKVKNWIKKQLYSTLLSLLTLYVDYRISDVILDVELKIYLSKQSTIKLLTDMYQLLYHHVMNHKRNVLSLLTSIKVLLLTIKQVIHLQTIQIGDVSSSLYAVNSSSLEECRQCVLLLRNLINNEVWKVTEVMRGLLDYIRNQFSRLVSSVSNLYSLHIGVVNTQLNGLKQDVETDINNIKQYADLNITNLWNNCKDRLTELKTLLTNINSSVLLMKKDILLSNNHCKLNIRLLSGQFDQKITNGFTTISGNTSKAMNKLSLLLDSCSSGILLIKSDLSGISYITNLDYLLIDDQLAITVSNNNGLVNISSIKLLLLYGNIGTGVLVFDRNNDNNRTVLKVVLNDILLLLLLNKLKNILVTNNSKDSFYMIVYKNKHSDQFKLFDKKVYSTKLLALFVIKKHLMSELWNVDNLILVRKILVL